jgi:hypothetical protein
MWRVRKYGAEGKKEARAKGRALQRHQPYFFAGYI